MRVLQGLLAIMSLQRAPAVTLADKKAEVVTSLVGLPINGVSNQRPIETIIQHCSFLDSQQTTGQLIINGTQLRQSNSKFIAFTYLKKTIENMNDFNQYSSKPVCNNEAGNYLVENAEALQFPAFLTMFFNHNYLIYSKGETPAGKWHKHSCGRDSVFDVKRNSSLGELISLGATNDRISGALNELDNTNAKRVKLPDLITYEDGRTLLTCENELVLNKFFVYEDDCEGDFPELKFDGKCTPKKISADGYFWLIFSTEIHKGEKSPGGGGALSIYFRPIEIESVKSALNKLSVTS
jgi:hypothetical protein